MWFGKTTSLWHVCLTEIIHVLPQLQLELRPLCFLLLLSQSLSQSPRSLEVEAALCFSFIRPMSSSQAMSNRHAPSVRQHPPGLVCSLLASAPCHGLAPSVCLASTFFFHADALSLSGSVSIYQHPSFPSQLSSFLAPTLTKPPKLNRWADYLRKGRRKINPLK